ncbi:MAG: hypothetical protein ACLFVU_06210 [Phycisphaerae bacterium]
MNKAHHIRRVPDPHNLLRYWTVGTEYAFTFMIVLAGGALVDVWLGSLPAFLLLGAALGYAGALYRLISQARQIQRENTPREQEHCQSEVDSP